RTFLRAKEGAAELPDGTPEPLEIDLTPFEAQRPRIETAAEIGRGGHFLVDHLATAMREEKEGDTSSLFAFLASLGTSERPVLVGAEIKDLATLRRVLGAGCDVLAEVDPEKPWSALADDLAPLGLAIGWGRTAARARETMTLLLDVLEEADPERLERFLSRIPMVHHIAILSPHGWFGQHDVLGRPDTGGQVVYILDQVRALEKEMLRSIHEEGLDIEPHILILTRLIPEADGTTCDQEVELVTGTRHARILRVPFRNQKGETMREWISRFEVWPYLEQYAIDCEKVVLAELGDRPDLLIGNYSDGNLVATLMSQRLGVTQCNIAHALEKAKYKQSDLFWRDHDAEYHFSCQFTADLIAMNTADFIITSTYQEIAGTREVIGQYESYSSFTMPGLYRVVSGIDPFDPKFNIVSPGADPEVFFPYSEKDLRVDSLRPEIEDLVLGGDRPDARGRLNGDGKPIIFAMSRLDHIKNMAGLVELYGRSDALREQADLLIAGGFMSPEESQDDDEAKQIETIHKLFDEFDLDGQARWITMRTDKTQVGELYRYVADTGGAFVQPALFEAFGLTVIEAMSSGLPTFATLHGGPLEIIENGKSGYHIDPLRPVEAAEILTGFFKSCREDEALWTSISDGAIQRVASRYTWQLYASRMLSLSRIYGFWKFMTNIERQETRRYLEMFYTLVYRKLAATVPGQ
nr:sucrose synthase [bacterium]